MSPSPHRTTTHRTVRTAVAVAAAAAITLAGSPAAFAAPTSDRWLSSTERTMLKSLNEQRVDAGCAPLRTRGSLNLAAGAHASDMVAQDYVDHVSPQGEDPFERARRFGTTANAENIHVGSTSGEKAAAALFASPGHRANITNCSLTKVGIGYDPGTVDIKINGVPLGAGSWVQLFAR